MDQRALLAHRGDRARETEKRSRVAAVRRSLLSRSPAARATHTRVLYSSAGAQRDPPRKYGGPPDGREERDRRASAYAPDGRHEVGYGDPAVALTSATYGGGVPSQVRERVGPEGYPRYISGW